MTALYGFGMLLMGIIAIMIAGTIIYFVIGRVMKNESTTD